MKGPVFVSVFSPLTLLLIVIAGFLFLDENLHLGMKVKIPIVSTHENNTMRLFVFLQHSNVKSCIFVNLY